MSATISHLTNDLVLLSVPSKPEATNFSTSSKSSIDSKEIIRSIYLSLNPPLSESNIAEAIRCLQQYDATRPQTGAPGTQTFDAEEESLFNAVTGKLLVGVYAQALDVYLNQASDVETEAEWWAEIERSQLKSAYYLLQTLPYRLFRLAHDVALALRSQNLSFSPSMLTVSSLSGILEKRTSGPSKSLASSLFPHLHTHPYTMPLSLASLPVSAISIPSSPPSTDDVISAIRRMQRAIAELLNGVLTFVSLPVELARQECHIKRKELEDLRDKRAEVLGALTLGRDSLVSHLRQGDDARRIFLASLNNAVAGQGFHTPPGPTPPLMDLLYVMSSRVIPSHISAHKTLLRSNSLLRPCRLTRLWPRIILLPPLVFFAAREVFDSREALSTVAEDAWQTLKGFWQGWLVEPIKDIVRTVRAGGEAGVIVQKESIDADLQSLERMAISLAKDKLGYGAEQLTELSVKIRLGDLTPILQIYEEDIRSPVRSAVSGTLLRSLFIQIQKAKVDLDQALAGIDKLLKSQELTFAFVGVAPALAIVYIAGGSLRGIWRGGKGQGRYGGRKKRVGAWLAMRRIERLLISQPKTEPSSTFNSLLDRSSISPLTAGLLLLSVSSLRTYAERYLPAHSRLREGFLEDVGDLENPSLDRHEKVKVVERMWRSWGGVLGWEGGGGSMGTM
ncbi:NCA2-domain-containing protein [Amylostereum chailletii]|nr:NCA2-domain-containing protein [Amylostereum chailletii]